MIFLVDAFASSVPILTLISIDLVLYMNLIKEPLLWLRLSSSLDEVIVFPIPAALYLVKNLLQVCYGSFLFFFLMYFLNFMVIFVFLFSRS